MGENKDGHDHGNDTTKKDEAKVLTVVFKVEMHCEGCGSRIAKAARGLAGVESVKVDCDKNRLSVVGELDPGKLRDKLESKLKKKIELVSPLSVQKEDQKQESKKPEGEKKADENKSKEDKKPQGATTAVLKMHLHCDGCIEKIHNILSKTDEVESVSIDKQKNMVTMKGTMDVKSVQEVLEKKMKRGVEIVPPKKSDGKDDSKESAEKKMEAAGDGGTGKAAEFNRMMMMPMPMAAHPGYSYGNGYGYNTAPAYPSYHPQQSAHAPQMFSDENPNACSVM